ncbi:p21-C-terminal region-binding protein-domain-containing protein [Suillus clintonianus]|uniref:p21-C-terminal region-binding protein-domain-containing protein n=1 Tax=Suillus clintonianus TaxID=1904413 RepID=UPI001B867882|nr:p21-C-terminal region-binding protein-domain-containing protein [Suillus clintonianus]KAG2156997.1 p21-C-terminal region-binding protein-domain-containing protein [Suillus clintonianus]
MSKRKIQADHDDSDSDSEDTPTFIDVDFDFFNLNPTFDYHSIKRLLDQLFGVDAEGLSTHALADLVLSQPDIGTTIKTDGEDSGPYAFLSVLNIGVHNDNVSIKSLVEYILAKSKGDNGFHESLSTILRDPQCQVGLVLCERLINMPVPVIPPMYRMLVDEIKDAVEENEPFNFTHLIFISRVYKLTPDEEDAMTIAQQQSGKASKRQKSQNTNGENERSADGVYPFHPEDEEIRKFASHHLIFPYSNAQPRDAESFGLDTAGRLMLVPAAQLTELARVLGNVFQPPGNV